jgi:ketosteroid isomerase-like protein
MPPGAMNPYKPDGHHRVQIEGLFLVVLANLPRTVAAFLNALEKRDMPALLAAFAKDAVLVDHGVEYSASAIRKWSELLPLEEGMTIRPINVARRDGKVVLTATREDRARSSAVRLDWWFTIADGKISALMIEAAKFPDLPAPVAAYVQAANTFDLEALLAPFADDAIVNDQLREYRGKQAIKGWAARDIVGDHVTMYVVTAVEHYGNAIVTANVDGDYDKRGLPDPLVVTFYFSINRDKIIQLIILRNETDV